MVVSGKTGASGQVLPQAATRTQTEAPTPGPRSDIRGEVYIRGVSMRVNKDFHQEKYGLPFLGVTQYSYVFCV